MGYNYFKGTVLHSTTFKLLQVGRMYVAPHRGLYQQQHCLTIYYWWRGRVSCGSCNGVVVLGTELLHHSV